MDWKYLKIIASFLVVLALSACGDDKCIRDCDAQGNNCQRECGAGHCIDADDWGYPKLYVSSELKDLQVNAEPLLNQYAEPIDSGQVIIDANSIPIVITIGKRDQWTSWFGGDINPRVNGSPDPNGFDAGRTVPDQECVYYLPEDRKSTAGVTTPIPESVFARDLSPTVLKVTKDFSGSTTYTNGPTKSPTVLGITPDLFADPLTPCYFRYGMGLYVGLAPNNGSDSRGSDVVLTYHIPDAKRPDYPYNKDISSDSSLVNSLNLAAQSRDGYLVRGLPKDELPGAQTGDRLYFKIVDRTYTDNSGGYHVKIKEGTRNPDPGALEKIASVFIDPLKIVMNRLYNGIVTHSSYVNAVQSALVLYIAFYGFVFMMGGLAEAKKTALERVIKIGLVTTLISTSSWDFFYNHLFSIFFGGTQEIAALLMNPFGDYDPNNPWYSMDKLLSKFWAGETWAKIWSTLFSNYLGILFIPAIGVSIGLFLVAVVRAMIIYLLSFTGIALLVVIAPIFLVFMLFTKTKELTREWIDQLIVFSVQQIVLLAGLGMFAAIIVTFLDRTIGYNVCWNVWSGFGIADISIFDFKFWMPDINVSPTGLSNIWIDTDGDGIKEMASRYVDLPYFDPIFDKDLITKYSSEKNFISFSDILLLIASIYLMNNFMAAVPTIASTLKGGASKDSANLFGSGEKLVGSLMGAAGSLIDNVKGAGQAIMDTGKDIASSTEGSYATEHVKRAGIVAGKKISASAAFAADKAMQPIKAAFKKSLLQGKLGAKLSKFSDRIGKAREQNARAMHNQMAAYANARHDIEVAHGITAAHEPELTKVGAGLGRAKIGDKSKVTERGDAIREKFRKDTVKVKELQDSIAVFSSKAATRFYSEDEKLKLAMPIFSKLCDKDLSREALQMLAMGSARDLGRIHEELSKQLEAAKAAGNKISDVNAAKIEEALDVIGRIADAGTINRTTVGTPKPLEIERIKTQEEKDQDLKKEKEKEREEAEKAEKESKEAAERALSQRQQEEKDAAATRELDAQLRRDQAVEKAAEAAKAKEAENKAAAEAATKKSLEEKAKAAADAEKEAKQRKYQQELQDYQAKMANIRSKLSAATDDMEKRDLQAQLSLMEREPPKEPK